MKVSIITVCYNSDSTIEKTIQSVVNQSYQDIEYIIVDGASKDNTLSIIKHYESLFNGRMSWISEPDKGLYDAMNKGIFMATGDLIGIINSDDIFYHNQTIDEIVTFHKLQDIDASVGDIVQQNESGKNIRFYSSKNWSPNKLRIGFMPPHPSIFFKRELFDKHDNYNINFKIGADYELIVRFFLKNKINWKYSGITTTAMLLGGLSSSGLSSYFIISKEIQEALRINVVKFSSLKINLRIFWKLFEFFNKYE
jgi:glycosyltransferase involved in cell wall biosynthesis